MERYGPELEADFMSEYSGLNLGKLIRSGQYARVLRLIGQLPAACRFHAAAANDPEHVEAIVRAQGGQREDYAPPLAQWKTENEQLAAIKDAITLLTGVQIARGGGKPGRQKPSPRPTPGFDEARRSKAKSEHKKLVAMVKRAGSANRSDQ